MKVEKSLVSGNTYELLISADSADLAPIKQKALKHLAHHIKLPGFRPGKAPLGVVEKNVEPSRLQSDVLDQAVNHFYVEAVRQSSLRVVVPPKIELKKFVPYTLLEFRAEVEAVGQVKLPDYTKIKVPMIPTAVDEKEVQEVLERLRLDLAEKTSYDGPAKDGDEALINFKGVDSKGQPVAGAEGKDYPLILGSNSFIPGFEANLLGLKSGGNKTFDLKFPANYQVAALQNKTVTFSVELTKLNQVKKPELGDDFAQKAGPFKTLEDLKQDITRHLLSERTRQARRTQENQIVKKIADQTEIKIPESLVEEQIDALEEEEKRNLAYRGQTWQEHLDEEGITAEEHRERKRQSAEDRVKGGLVLSEIAEREGIKVTPEELEIRVQILKGQYQDKTMQSELDKPENRRDIESQILTEKTLDKLIEFSA